MPKLTSRGQWGRRATSQLTLGVLLVAAFFLSAAQAQTYSILFNFSGGLSGAYPYDGLTMDRAGNFYGTTYDGGSLGMGMVFKLTNHNGSWTFSPLYSFRGGNDGSHPWSSVTIGPDGALYGATPVGGLGGPQCQPGGCGTVYKLTPPARLCNNLNCPWTETVLYRLAESSTGVNSPYSRVIFDSAGNMYGTAWGGGTGGCASSGCGAVYKMTRSGGSWNFSLIYSFTGQGDGTNPYSPLVMDAAGNLYGTTYYGSGFFNGYGTVFELTPSAGGWSESTLHTFSGGSDGGSPFAGLTFDDAGNLYGATTEVVHQFLQGVAFELARSGSGWSYSVISILSGSVDGNLAVDHAGNVYGATTFGGAHTDGYAFRLSHTGAGWTQTDLHDFGETGDGISPWCSVVLDAAGNLYGTTNGGGTNGGGVIWKIAP